MRIHNEVIHLKRDKVSAQAERSQSQSQCRVCFGPAQQTIRKMSRFKWKSGILTVMSPLGITPVWRTDCRSDAHVATYPADEFFEAAIKMTPINKNQQLMDWLKTAKEIELAILFGSYAKGTENSQSDIDLAIQLVSGAAMTATEKLNYLVSLEKLLKANVDVIDLKTVGQPLLSEIIKHGLLLKGNKMQYAELALKNINTTQDFMPAIDRMMATRRKRWLNHG